jgi:hypothetical protein
MSGRYTETSVLVVAVVAPVGRVFHSNQPNDDNYIFSVWAFMALCFYDANVYLSQSCKKMVIIFHRE